jgi:hypothetical protein
MMVRAMVALAAVACAVPGAAGADCDCAAPVAIVTEVAGAVRMLAQRRSTHPDLSDPVREGATLVLERGARIVLVYPAGASIFELSGPGRFVARAAAVEPRSGSGGLLRRDLVPMLRALRIHPEGTTLQGSTAMRGVSALELQAAGPTGTRLTRDPLRVCWRPLGADWAYRVRLIDDDGMVLYEQQTRASALELPVTLFLPADAQYLWHVRATGPNGRFAEAAGQFRRLDADSEQALLRAGSALPQLDATGRALVRIARRQQGFAPPAADCANGADADVLSASTRAGAE